jgi:transposase
MFIQHPVAIGVDPHAETLTAAAVDPNGKLLWNVTVPNTTTGIQALLQEHPPNGQTWAIEGTGTFGRLLTNQLLTQGATVREVPTRLTARQRSRHGFTKTDKLDATAIARIGHAETLPTPQRHPHVEALRILTRHRQALVNNQVQTINRLKARLREWNPDTAPTNRLRSRHQLQTLTTLTEPATNQNPYRQALAYTIRTEATTALQRHTHITQLTNHIKHTLPPAGEALQTIPGIGLIGAATIIAHTGNIQRFPTDGHYARYTGTAPLDASSGNTTRQRLNRWGNRPLNKVIHLAILTQLRHHGPAHHYINRRLQEGKTKPQAIRAAKRHLTRTIYRTLQHHPLT